MRPINPTAIANRARNIFSMAETNLNRFMGRELIPVQRDTLCIETSSLCNLKCRFCAYEKKQSARVSMKTETFKDYVEQAIALGYRHFVLTPCTGDVFMDRHIFDKLDFLDNHPQVRGYEFFTNFTIPDAGEIKRLLGLNKLLHLTISLYGHDRNSFIAITKSTAKVYDRLLANLDTLYGLLGRKTFPLEFGLRSTNALPRLPVTDLLKSLKRFENAGVKVRTSRTYNNWGGYISTDDVKDLDIYITGTDEVYKQGACVRLFTTVQVMASGIVNGCACRDVDATLRIGDLTATPLRDILSSRNETYMQLIEEQQRGEFRQICGDCDFYKSIYHGRFGDWRRKAETQSIAEFAHGLDAQPAATNAKGAP